MPICVLISERRKGCGFELVGKQGGSGGLEDGNYNQNVLDENNLFSI